MTAGPDSTTRGAAARADIMQRRPQTAFHIVDAHAHLGQDAVMFMPVHGAAQVISVMDRCGVSAALISSFQGIRSDARFGNDETAAAVGGFHGRYLGAMVINPWQQPTEELSRWTEDARMSAIKLHPDVHEYPLSGKRYEPVWEFAEQTGCPVLTHTWHGSEFDGWEQVERVCARYPGVTLIAGHSGVLPRGLDVAIGLTTDHRGLYLELCGSFSHHRYIERMVREAGADRVLYGSDAPFIEMRSGLGRLLFSELTDRDRELVLGRTATTLLSWRVRADSPGPSTGTPGEGRPTPIA